MANSFDKADAIDKVRDALARAEQVVADIERAFNSTRTELGNHRATIVANANGYFTAPDDLTRFDEKVAAFKARLTALGI